MFVNLEHSGLQIHGRTGGAGGTAQVRTAIRVGLAGKLAQNANR